MRAYIFTEHERDVIQRFLRGEKPPALRKIKHRILHFEELRGDVELYLKLRERFKQT